MYGRTEPSYSWLPDPGPDADCELASLHSRTTSVTASSRRLSAVQTTHGVEETEFQDSVEALPGYTSTNKPSTHDRFDKSRRRSKLDRYFRIHTPGDSNPPFRGWRKAVIAAAILASCVLAINATFLIVARIKFEIEDGVGLIFTGNCDVVKRWDTALHLLINLLGTALLAASSFTMQCLSSPTRSEVNAAHADHVPLEIGLASFTNLFRVKYWKSILWLLLCLSTVPLHLLWNSTIFSTASANLFSFVVADESFLHGAVYQIPDDSALDFCYDVGGSGSSGDGTPSNVTQTIYDGYTQGVYSNLSVIDCFGNYTDPDTTLYTRRNLIVIVQRPIASSMMGRCGYNGLPWNGSSIIGVGANWLPGPDWTSSIAERSSPSEKSSLEVYLDGNSNWSIGNYTVTSCKSEMMQSTSFCQLQFTSYILYVVVACNLVKVLCMCTAARYLWSLDEPILATIGDAVSSFLEIPDNTTEGLCLLDFGSVGTVVSDRSSRYNPVYSRKKQCRLYFATSYTRWWSTMTLCTLYLILGFALWHGSLSLTRYSESETMKLGFGAVDPDLLLGIQGQSGRGLLTDIIVANSFQLALTTTYFLYNSLYTAQCAALEWTSYAQKQRKSLRVTWPRGQQRSTYYLQLPYRYGIPLTVLLVLMHFLISQSIFLARLQFYDWAGNPVDTAKGYTDVGFSPRATLTTCLVGLVLILAQIAHACRPLDSRIPIHGNNSLAISAMCHAELDHENPALPKHSLGQSKESDITTKLLSWGVTREPTATDLAASTSTGEYGGIGEGAGHCTFSADVVEMPQIGKKYR